MVRISVRHRTMRITVLLLIVFLNTPISLTDDYMSLSPEVERVVGSEGSSNQGHAIFAAMSGDESDSSHTCSCLSCISSLAESLVHVILPPKAGERLNLKFAHPVLSSFHREIFHPPYA